MPKTRALIGDRGTTFTRSFASYSLCCPSRATLYTGPVRAQPRRAQQHAAVGRLHAAGHLELAAAVAAGARATGPCTSGKFLNGYGRLSPPTVVPPGFNDWHGTVDPSTYSFSTTRSTRTAPCARTPAVLLDRLLRPAGRRADRRGRACRQALLHVGRLPGPSQRRAARARRSGRARDAGRGAPARERLRVDGPAAAALVQRGRRVGQAAGDAPAPRRSGWSARRRSRRATSSGWSRCWRSTTRSPRSSRRCASIGELDDTLILFTSDNGFFHGEHRVPTGKLLVYEPSIRLPLLMRGPGVPAGGGGPPARDQRGPRSHDPRRRRRAPGPRPGRPLAARARRATRASSGAGSCCRGREPAGPDHRGAAQLPLEVRRAPHRGGGAVRPGARSR